jgi:hypothetical protein
VEKYPETRGEYDALLVQSSLLFDHPVDPMAERTIKRIGEKESAKIPLLIHQQQWKEAQELLKQSPESTTNLEKAIYLMRMGFVEKQLNNISDSRKNYMSLADLLKKEPEKTAIFRNALEGSGQNLLQWLEKELGSLAN